ncbi:MAG: phage major capsid protein [Oxalicibacterium faecigallinarum]|uniref:phage major capsid protein n=1 Tax=Oxalicibacterium faecigallinarum TaxID=573741 RepID=UPI002808EA50|nr:phage major capsid protein [Oxalicibacterium faecigallinarum]MDQ7970748.1 phage major capsid protein [Oxalicibacterium faecigallinarum]
MNKKFSLSSMMGILYAVVYAIGEKAYDMLFAHQVRMGFVKFDSDAIQKSLDKISDQVKEIGEKALSEAKKAGDMSAETKGKVDELLVKQGELQARLQEVEQKQARPAGGGKDEGIKSAGYQLIESEEFKEKAANWSKGSKHNMSLKAITSAGASAGDGIAPDRLPGVQLAPQRRLTVRDLISPGRTASNLVQYLQESGFTNSAATVAEGTKKPESDIDFDLKQAPVVKIAHFIKATSEILSDFPQLQSIIDVKLRYGLSLIEEAQLLKGSGVGNNLNGIYTQATPYAAPIVVANPTRMDILRLALLQAELAEYPSTGIVMHPSDWAAIELTKDSTGSYIFANPQSRAQPALWGRPVVPTQAMTVDNFLVGAFQQGAQVFDREAANVAIASENEDDFVNNLVTILVEERLALAVYRTEAFVKGKITPAA